MHTITLIQETKDEVGEVPERKKEKEDDRDTKRCGKVLKRSHMAAHLDPER